MQAMNFAATISISLSGAVSSSSSVPLRRSSANWRMVMSGTSRISWTAAWKKMCTRVACLATISETVNV